MLLEINADAKQYQKFEMACTLQREKMVPRFAAGYDQLLKTEIEVLIPWSQTIAFDNLIKAGSTIEKLFLSLANNGSKKIKD